MSGGEITEQAFCICSCRTWISKLHTYSVRANARTFFKSNWSNVFWFCCSWVDLFRCEQRAVHAHAIAGCHLKFAETAGNGKQPVHANLTSISNLSTTPSGRFLVTNGSAIVARSLQNSDPAAISNH